MSPHEVVVNPATNKISHLVLARNEQDEDTGEWHADPEETLKKRCDFVISAFGSALTNPDVREALSCLEFDKWNSAPKVDPMDMSTSMPGVFCGGDLAGTAETAVEAVADGKLAAWSIHRYLQV